MGGLTPESMGGITPEQVGEMIPESVGGLSPERWAQSLRNHHLIWKKPKGMHWRTFEALKAKVERQDEIANFAFLCRTSKMVGSDWPL